ncbi:peptide ABC transporter [Alphaproteobacteria bacterium KMM 3653]|uniref:Peptide ABC transporter n=1 Tax=Harenicola maris TaxID=2841044 RepID=A0AAP2G3P7_9RHOB|nr:peptide ABC transporter [Harenicola maris]
MTDRKNPTHITRRTALTYIGAGMAALALPGQSYAASDKTLRYGLSTFPPALTPWNNTGAASNYVKLCLYRGLMGYDSEAQLVPEVAESYEWVDGNTIVFKLREGAKFHNGEPVTAEDVIFTFTSITAEDSSAYLKSSFESIDSMEAMDATTVKFTLKLPSAVFLSELANYCAGIVWKGSDPEDPIGCGPYTKTDEERGVFIEVTAFPDFYSEGEPRSGKIRFTAYSDQNLRYAALETGDVDVIEYLPWTQFDTVEESEELNIAATVSPFMLALFNVEKDGPFKNPLVRRAVGYAIQRQDVVDGVFAGRGTPLLGIPNPPGSPYDLSDPSIEYSYDPEKAKALLAEAGYPNGFSCRLLGTSTYGMHQDTAAIVQAYLQMIGINATLDLPDWATRVKKGKDGDYDIAVHGLSGFYNDPNALWPLLHSGPSNYTRSFGFASDRIDDLLERGRAAMDEAEREEIYKELAVAYYEEVPQIPINWRGQAHAMQASVKGFKGFPGWLNTSSGFSFDTTEPS